MGQRIKELILKLQNQQCTEAEVDILLEYFNFGSQEELEREMQQHWQEAKVGDHNLKQETVWKKIRSEIGAETGRPLRSALSPKAGRSRKNRSFHFILKIAAIFIGLGMISVLVFRDRLEQPEVNGIVVEIEGGEIESLEDHEAQSLEMRGVVYEDDKIVYPPSETATGELKYHTIRIPHGRKFQVVLSDGSKVFLNSGSTFRYPVSFHRGKARKVYLEGEAFFVVAKRKEEKFLVQAGKLETEVLGTEFNISSHEGDAKTEIVLVEGSIRVNGEESLVLEPDQKLTVLKTSGSFQVEEVEASEYIEWIDGIIWFKNESFREIVPRLERKFDVKIENDLRKLEDQRFTGRFETETLEEILEVFKIVTDFHFEVRGKEVHIEKPKQ